MTNPLQRIFVGQVLVDGEDGRPLALLETALAEEIAPVGSLENIWMSKLAADLWRLRRAFASERVALSDRMIEQDILDDYKQVGLGLSEEALTDIGIAATATPVVKVLGENGKQTIIPPPDEKLGKYEGRLQASALAIMKEIRTLQAPRKLAALKEAERLAEHEEADIQPMPGVEEPDSTY